MSLSPFLILDFLTLTSGTSIKRFSQEAAFHSSHKKVNDLGLRTTSFQLVKAILHWLRIAPAAYDHDVLELA